MKLKRKRTPKGETVLKHITKSWVWNSSLGPEQLLGNSYHFDTHDMHMRHPELVQKAEFDLLENCTSLMKSESKMSVSSK